MQGTTDIIIHSLLFISLYFEIFLLFTFIEKRDVVKMGPQKLHRLPSVTIVVPCFNEERTVSKTVLSLLNLDYPKHKLDIFIINDGSTDSTTGIINRFAKNKQITVFHKENGGKHSALNLGIEKARTELIGCLDADSYVEKDALLEIVKHFEDKKVAAVTPAILVPKPKNVLQFIQKAEYSLSIFIRKIFAFMGTLFVTPGPFSIFRIEIFQEIGNYKYAHSTEDLEMALRMQTHHLRIENAHTARVYTTVPSNFASLYKQRVRWTYGFLKNAVDYRHMFLNARYGSLGLLVLPVTMISIFGALYFAMLAIVGVTQRILEKLVEIRAVGLEFNPLALDWFYINTQSFIFIVYVLVLMTLLLIILGKKLASERKIWSLDLPLYLFLYGFIAPFWLGKAVFDTVFSRGVSWK